jgi:hypothetical protein
MLCDLLRSLQTRTHVLEASGEDVPRESRAESVSGLSSGIDRKVAGGWGNPFTYVRNHYC